MNGSSNCQIYLNHEFSAVGQERSDHTVANQLAREFLIIFLSGARRHLWPGWKIVAVAISGLREFIQRNFITVFDSCKILNQGLTHTGEKSVTRRSIYPLRVICPWKGL